MGEKKHHESEGRGAFDSSDSLPTLRIYGHLLVSERILMDRSRHAMLTEA